MEWELEEKDFVLAEFILLKDLLRKKKCYSSRASPGGVDRRGKAGVEDACAGKGRPLFVQRSVTL